MFKISLLEGIKNIDKNKTMTYLTVFLFAFLFLLQGYTYSYYSVSSARNKVTSEEAFNDYDIYEFGPSMDGFNIWLENNYMDELPLETIEFTESLDRIEHLKWVTEIFTALEVFDFKGSLEVFADPDLLKDSHLGMYSLIASPNFHKAESYRVIKGRDFTDEHMIYVKGKPRPILLGFKYQGVYELGDIIKISDKTLCFGDWVSEFEVIGFLEEDTTIIDRGGSIVYDLDNYIVFPAIYLSQDEYEQLGDDFKNGAFKRYIVQNSDYFTTLFKMKLYIEPEYKEIVLEEIQEALNEYSVISQSFRLVSSGQASLKRASRTEALTEFFALVTSVTMIFAVATVLISIANRVSRNMKDYAIHITVGATRGNAVLFIVAEMALILVCSMILGIIATKWMMYYINMPFYFWRFLGVYALTSVVVLVLSAIVARIAMRKYDICTLIK